MRFVMRAAVCVLVAVGSAHGASAGAVWARSDDYGAVQVITAPGASDLDREAAQAFARYWEQSTSHPVTMAETPGSGINVWIGTDTLPAALKRQVSTKGLGPDGIRIRTFSGRHGRDLVLAGNGPRARLYAVYAFLEQYMGIRWLAPDATYIPAPPDELAAINYSHTPPFGWRSIHYPNVGGEPGLEWRRAHMMSTDVMSSAFGGHSLYSLMPPDVYFADHPEYYAMVDGKRIAIQGDWHSQQVREEQYNQAGQLCMTNPDVQRILAEAVLKEFREHPERDVASVSQMDWGGFCECPTCAAINEREGSLQGSLLTGLNKVADIVAKEMPDKKIHTFAYAQTVKPPAHIKPRPNIIIQYCTIDADRAVPIDDPNSAINRPFADDLVKWSRLTKGLYLWDYIPDFRNWMTPHPNFQTLKPNIAFFAKSGAYGLFEQACPSPQGELAPLRSYIVAELMWDPTKDDKALMDEFLTLYYGQAAPYIKQYIDLMTKTLKDSGLVITCFDKGFWITSDMVEQARQLFADAFAAAESDTIRERVRLAYVPVQYAALICAPKIEVQGDTLVLTRPAAPTPTEYAKILRSVGMMELGEGTPPEFIHTELKGSVPQRHAESPLVRLENANQEIWIAPAFQGSVLRWRLKGDNTELLKGYETYTGARPGTWQDWVNTPSRVEGPPAQAYKVISQTPTEAVIEAGTEDGLVVRRRMTLLPDGETLEVALTLSNPTDGTLEGNVKGHPEFFSQGAEIPEIWGQDADGWKQLNANWDDRKRADGKYLDVGTYHRLAFYVPEKNLTLVDSFDPAELGGLLWFINAESGVEQVNLELLPKSKPLQPGESRTMTSRYRVYHQPPAEL